VDDSVYSKVQYLSNEIIKKNKNNAIKDKKSYIWRLNQYLMVERNQLYTSEYIGSKKCDLVSVSYDANELGWYILRNLAAKNSTNVWSWFENMNLFVNYQTLINDYRSSDDIRLSLGIFMIGRSRISCDISNLFIINSMKESLGTWNIRNRARISTSLSGGCEKVVFKYTLSKSRH